MPVMRRTSILLDPGLLAELERIAQREGRPTAHVIRDALQRYAAEAGKRQRTLPAFVGLGTAPGSSAPSANSEPANADGTADGNDE